MEIFQMMISAYIGNRLPVFSFSSVSGDQQKMIRQKPTVLARFRHARRVFFSICLSVVVRNFCCDYNPRLVSFGHP